MIIMIIIRSRWYFHKVWYIVYERRQYSNTRHIKHSEQTSRKDAPARRLKQTSNADSMKNEALGDTGQNVSTT